MPPTIGERWFSLLSTPRFDKRYQTYSFLARRLQRHAKDARKRGKKRGHVVSDNGGSVNPEVTGVHPAQEQLDPSDVFAAVRRDLGNPNGFRLLYKVNMRVERYIFYICIMSKKSRVPL